MSTIRKISEKTNLSIATVSKALNGKYGVKQETRDLILNVANELNYHPNLNARSLKSGRSRTIGVITEDFTVFNAPFIMDGIAAACDEVGYHYIISNMRFYQRYGNIPSDESESESITHEHIKDMLSRQVDGIIYLGCHSHRIISLAKYKGMKFVCAYCISNDAGIPYIIYNDTKASYDATVLLLQDGGRKKIGMITGPKESMHVTNRTRGHLEALYDNSIPYNPQFTLEGDWERDSGFRLGEQLVRAGVTAIFAHNDLMALGVLDYCKSQGVVVGEDLKLIGFDNREVSIVSNPTLSTVALPLFEIGRTSVTLLLDMLNGADEASPGEVSLDCTVISRESTKV
ncbi:MAG: LacI family transcriptional regulator [Clostridiales Family XIII bacterium]|nr:LacI family transcriptional regulator [Clostridiales Family XIII bacterium]